MAACINHPAFPQPETSNKTIWRYMGDDKARWLFKNQRLYMPKPDQFGDPLEATAPKGEDNWWLKRISEEQSQEKLKILKRNYAAFKGFEKYFRDRYFISCWRLCEEEDEGLWNYYVAGPEALVIKSKYEKLVAILPDILHVGYVRYIDYAIDKFPDWNFMQYIMHKDISYAFEKEVRVVGFPLIVNQNTVHPAFTENMFEWESNSGNQFLAPKIDLQLLIEEVIMHPDSSLELRTEISEYCEMFDIPFRIGL